jgi:Fe-S cluster assembly ATP-binding protein
MLRIQNLHVKLADQPKQILHGANLTIRPGEVHVIQGANGSGKSTLASVVSGNPSFQITEGEIELVNETYPDYLLQKVYGEEVPAKFVLNELEPYQRSLLGIFLAHQYPLEIPGVNLVNFLRLAYNAHQPKDIPVFKFRKLLKEVAETINYPDKLLERNLNEGFSGGEKKKTEILQLALLQPRYAFLDETDSGLDQKAIKDVFTGLNTIRKQKNSISFVIITHYEKIFEYIKPDFIHTMENGILVKSETRN